MLDVQVPLDGVRVLDLSWGVAGPYASGLLVALGAEVIKVESRNRPDIMRQGFDKRTGKPWGLDESPVFDIVHFNKLGCSADVATKEGAGLVKALVPLVDLVVESYRPGVLDKFGLGYEALRQCNPSVIMLSVSTAGHSGPESQIVGIAPIFNALGGLGYMTGYADGPPTEIRWTVDFMVALEAAYAAMGALRIRQETGKGQWLDFSGLEGIAFLIGDALVDYAANGRVQSRQGNRDEVYAPHNCYPCRGHDRWISIAVTNQQEWQALCEEMERPDLLRDPRFLDELTRWEHQEELDGIIAEWTRNFEASELMRRLQASGVAAIPSFDASDLFSDLHLRSQGAYVEVKGSEGRSRTLMQPPFRFRHANCGIEHLGPRIGEHNQYVLGQLLGLANSDITRLRQEGAV